jgi:general secretion pathway protein E
MRDVDRNRFLTHLRSSKCGIIIMGPPGSGKTSTIMAGLVSLNPQDCNILSIEEPPEIYIPFIYSTEITERWTHKAAIALTNRLNPSFVNVGETLDETSAVTTLNHTLSSVPTSTSLHTNNFVEGILRLKALGVELERIETGVTLWVSQRLLNPVCKVCAKHVPTPDNVRGVFAGLGMTPPVTVFQRNVTLGQEDRECLECFGHGILQDRIAIFEVVPTNQKLRQAIRAQASPDELADAGYTQDVWPLIASGIILLRDGTIDHETFMKISLPLGGTSTWL